jgi:hypothetical protein
MGGSLPGSAGVGPCSSARRAARRSRGCVSAHHHCRGLTRRHRLCRSVVPIDASHLAFSTPLRLHQKMLPRREHAGATTRGPVPGEGLAMAGSEKCMPPLLRQR